MRTPAYLLRVAWKQLRHCPARSFLAVLAVASAVALWVAVYGFTENYRQSLAQSIRTMGYEVLVTLTDGSKVFRITRANHIRVTDPFPGKSGKVTVDALGADGSRGPAAQVRPKRKRG